MFHDIWLYFNQTFSNVHNYLEKEIGPKLFDFLSKGANKAKRKNDLSPFSPQYTSLNSERQHLCIMILAKHYINLRRNSEMHDNS